MQKNGISTYSDKKISVGDIRKTQLITTYGVGAIVDFKNDTVVIASTDDWDYSPNDAGEVENRKIFNFLRSFISFMLLSVCRYPHHIAYRALIFTCPTSSFQKTNQTKYTPRYFSVRYSFLSNNCSIERFLNLGMLYPNGELRAFTKSFV